MSLPSASASSSAPKKPVQLDPSKLYVHISTPSSAPPPTLPAPGVALIYVGLVGELAGEYIYEVAPDEDGERGVSGAEWSAERMGEVLRALRGHEGVSAVKVLESRQRVKRDEF